MKICVTGSDGQLGSEFKFLKSNNNNWIFLSIKDLDISDKSKVSEFFDNNKFDYIINCAAFTNVDKAEKEIDNAYLVNKNAVANLVDACCKHKIKLVHFSTDYVFDGNCPIGYDELSQTNPLGVYGKSKNEGEKIIRSSFVKSVIIRTSWLYSTFGNNFVKTILNLSEKRKSIDVVTDQTGSPTYARDLALVVCNNIITDKYSWKIGGDLFHFSNKGRCSWYQFAKKIIEFNNIKVKINKTLSSNFKRDAERPKFSILNCNKFEKEFGVSISTWEKSLKIMMNNLNNE
tara:strand:- start:1119 stop:1982 length:864 start_codon:yes stop_codon:yes gene_type:complete